MQISDEGAVRPPLVDILTGTAQVEDELVRARQTARSFESRGLTPPSNLMDNIDYLLYRGQELHAPDFRIQTALKAISP